MKDTQATLKMSERERFLITLIYLMQQEIQCLRSVISENNEGKSEYVQFNRAEILREARETLEHKL